MTEDQRLIAPRFAFSGESVDPLDPVQRRAAADVERKLREGEYTTEAPPCVVCDGDDFVRVAEQDRYGLHHAVVICTRCGLTQTRPRLDASSMAGFYDNEYRPLYAGSGGGPEHTFRTQYANTAAAYDFIRAALGDDLKGANVFEVGAAAGGGLAYFRERGHAVAGCDLGSEYAGFAREQHDIDVRVGRVDEVDVPFEPGLVVVSHVLEHTPDPVRVAADIRTAWPTVPVYVEVPGLKATDVWFGWDARRMLQNAHTFYFSLTTLGNAMRRAGYEVVAGTEYVRTVLRPAGSAGADAPFENDYRAAVRFLERLELLRSIRGFPGLGALTRRHLVRNGVLRGRWSTELPE